MDEQEKPEIFKAEVIEKDGVKHLKIHVRTETVTHPDGTKSVIIHAPSLDLINKTKL